MEYLYRKLPKVDELLEAPEIVNLQKKIPHSIILQAVREVIENARKAIASQESEATILKKIENIPIDAVELSIEQFQYKLNPVINATGVVLHTNLGRAPLADDALNRLSLVAEGYTNLELNIESGKRGSRYSHIEKLITDIVGGEAAMVVNNNAAAVMLVLSTLAKGKEAIVSRGELIEIGGAFRIPDVMEQSGAKLVEVGTTNKTHLEDYKKAITEDTAVLLKVHTSNYKILGFTESVSLNELKELSEDYKIPLVEDLGSGVLIDLSKYGLSYEPTVMESIKGGVDVVTFSGDKLLGGPQAGIIVGRKKLIDLMKKNPLTRAFRVDKFTIAALEATLRYYYNEESAIESIPTLRMLTMPIKTIKEKAEQLKKHIEENCPKSLDIEIREDYSEVGGGSLPLEKLPTYCIALNINGSIARFEEGLRKFEIPVLARINKNTILLDPRTIPSTYFEVLGLAINFALEYVKEDLE